ncbi:hypothetical protein C8J56DRAFT_1139369 [Mycena floridula]|nr:hypothetical protein C8J56DRAFT_1139369 [Mycena floridula]
MVEDKYLASYLDNLVVAIFGLYFWELFNTLDFDFSFICGRRKFKWPMIFYFYSRYAFLASLVGTIFDLNTSRQVNCQALALATILLKHSALWASSVTLSIRMMTLWEYSRRIMVIMVPLITFHMVAACLSSTLDLNVVWSEVAFAKDRCVALKMSLFSIAILYTYTMVFDFIILCLTSYKLLYGGDARIRLKQIPIFMLLFRDGLIYFVVVFLVALVADVYLIVDHKTAMAIGMHVAPATATVSSSPSVAPRFCLINQEIAAGSAVRRLYNYAGPGPETTRANDGISLTIPYISNICTESEIP